jgi:hypothetical protein
VSEPGFGRHRLAIALQQPLIDVAGSRPAQEGRQTKMEELHQYLTGPAFVTASTLSGGPAHS